MSALAWLASPSMADQEAKTVANPAFPPNVPTCPHRKNSEGGQSGRATTRSVAQSSENVPTVPTVPTTFSYACEKQDNSNAKPGGLQHVGDLLPGIVAGVALASIGISSPPSEYTRKPMRVVVPYTLHSGGGGQIIDPDGLLSAVNELRQRYGKRLNLENLAEWFEQRVTLVWPVGDRWQVLQEQLALDAVTQYAKEQA